MLNSPIQDFPFSPFKYGTNDIVSLIVDLLKKNKINENEYYFYKDKFGSCNIYFKNEPTSLKAIELLYQLQKEISIYLTQSKQYREIPPII